MIIICILISLSVGLQAGNMLSSDESRLTFGAEWSFISSFHCRVHHNFFSEEGYRVDLNQRSMGYENNGELELHCGYNLDNDWNLSLHTGFVGIYNIGNAIPVSLRLTRFFKENKVGDRWLCYIDAGSGVCLKENPQMIGVGKIGGGYRLSLSKTTKMDFLLAYRTSLTHPKVVFDGYVVPFEKTNRNNAFVTALSLGISLTF